MAEAKTGDNVQITYTGKLDGGQEFDRSPDGKPISFKIGGGEMIPELENHVIGMKVGEKKKFTIAPEKGFGEYRKDLVIEVPQDRLPKDRKFKEGDGLQFDIQGVTAVGRIIAVADDSVTVDVNHPLAGHTLHFEIKLEGIDS